MLLKYIHANGAKATIPSKRNAKIHKKRCSPVLPELHPMFDYFYTSSPIRSYSAEPVIFTFTKSPDISISPVLTKT